MTLYNIDLKGKFSPLWESAISDLIENEVLVPVEPEHQHQWLPWLTLPSGSSWTQCVPCGEQFQYDHVGVNPYAGIGGDDE